MEKKSGLSLMFDAIRDRRLYGWSFFSKSLPYLFFGLVIQYFIFYLLTPQWLIVYVTFYAVLILVSGAFAKNLKREFHLMSWWFAYLLFLTSALSKAFALVAPFENTISGLMQRLLIVAISEPAFLASVITIAVFGQRKSLRKSIGLDENFFDEEKKRWKKEIDGFPELDKMLADLNGARFVAGLFDKGLFNLTILWSCNVVEEVVDVLSKQIIKMKPEEKPLFRDENGFRLPYPSQIRNLGYDFCQSQNKTQLDIDSLWQTVRNKIAHHNYTPTFDETNGTMIILTLFAQETPTIVKNWDLS